MTTSSLIDQSFLNEQNQRNINKKRCLDVLNYKLSGGQELPFYYGQVPPFFPVITKQHIISSIFPSKLVFDNNIVRTLEVNKVVSLICSYNKGPKGNKKGKLTNFGVLSLGVEDMQQLSNPKEQYINDLSSLKNLKMVVNRIETNL